MQAGVTHQGFGCITLRAWGAMMGGSWSWALFILRSWPSLQNNMISTSLVTAPPSAPRLYVNNNSFICIISMLKYFICKATYLQLLPTKSVLQHDLNVPLSACVSRLCHKEGSIYLHPSCTPTWRDVGWGRSWWGEAESWRWYKKTHTSVHIIRWVSSKAHFNK